jgi:hypothetical protein
VSPFEVPEPNLQLTFYHRLIEVRETYLLDALLSLVAELEIAQLDRELSQFVSNAALQRVAGWGLRGEIVFAVPYVLSTSPELLGYYRLLLGFSQKQFYSARYGFAPLKPLEERGRYQGIMRRSYLIFAVRCAPVRSFLCRGYSSFHSNRSMS